MSGPNLSLVVENDTRPALAVPPLPDALRSVMAVVPLGTIAQVSVLASRRSDSMVLSEIERLRRAGFSIEVLPVSAEDLADATERSAHTQGAADLDARIVSVARSLFAEAATLLVSDIHVHVRARHTDIFMRVNGALRPINQMTREDGHTLLRALYQGLSISADSSYLEHESQAAQITASSGILPDNVLGVRVQRGPMLGGEFMILRLLYRGTAHQVRTGRPASLRSLQDGIALFRRFGYTQGQAQVLAKVSRQPFGLSIFSGPTGSAKSSALKTALEFQHGLYPTKSIYTIEDPAEYPIAGAVQISLSNVNNEEERRTLFGKTLRVVMRADPDIIMVGEIRDETTAGLAFDAVLTGHQMWSTVHTQDAFLIATRLIRLGLDPRDFLNPTILRVLVGQRLVPTLCTRCALPFLPYQAHVDADLVETMRGWDVPLDRVRMAHPQGCPHCHHTGIEGRAIIAEVVEVTSELTARLREDVGAACAAWRAQDGHLSFSEHAVMHLLAGRCDPAHLVAESGYFPTALSPALRAQCTSPQTLNRI